MQKKGQALITCYMVVAVSLVIAASLFSKAMSEKNLSLRNRMTMETFYLAEGGIENAISVFTHAIANYQIPSNIQNFNVTTTFSTFGGATVTDSISRLEDSDRLLLEGATNVLARNYEVVAHATHPANAGITVTLHQIFARRLIPTFQHAVFYNDDLEILPGKDMILTGRIHCNQDIYADADSSQTLTIDSNYFHSAGDIFNQRKDNGAELSGDVSIRVTKPGSPKYEEMDNLDSDDPSWTTEATERWKGTVQSADHGVTKQTAPSVGSIQPDGYYNTQADVVISDNEVKRNGNVLTEGVDYPVGTVKTTTTLYNNREGEYVEMVEIDLKKLSGEGYTDANGNPYPNNLPSNGLLYVTQESVGASYEPGVKLVNGQEINSDGGLTVVSDEPVYIQGDYNTVEKKPASVICDSVNLLSNNWGDSKSTLALSSRNPTETTFNCAIIAGVDETTPGHYNGGLENYPRLHENWSGINLNIKGSFVELWKSEKATGAWIYGSPQYTAPRRTWSYDIDFNDVSRLPPFTPWAVEIQRLAWWKE